MKEGRTGANPGVGPRASPSAEQHPGPATWRGPAADGHQPRPPAQRTGAVALAAGRCVGEAHNRPCLGGSHPAPCAHLAARSPAADPGPMDTRTHSLLPRAPARLLCPRRHHSRLGAQAGLWEPEVAAGTPSQVAESKGRGRRAPPQAEARGARSSAATDHPQD